MMTMAKTYRVNEIFYSIQGEGIRAGTANVFLRFTGCNLQCSVDEKTYLGEAYRAGFDCDTEFMTGRDYTLKELLQALERVGSVKWSSGARRGCRNVVLTGGEPALQADKELIDALRENGWYIAIETNGTVALPDGINWICVSPKSAWHTLRQKKANEFKLVRHVGQALRSPDGFIQADWLVVSPAFGSDGSYRDNLEWCIAMVKDDPGWRLSAQLHKLWRLR